MSDPKVQGGSADFPEDRMTVPELGVAVAFTWLLVWLLLRVVGVV